VGAGLIQRQGGLFRFREINQAAVGQHHAVEFDEQPAGPHVIDRLAEPDQPRAGREHDPFPGRVKVILGDVAHHRRGFLVGHDAVLQHRVDEVTLVQPHRRPVAIVDPGDPGAREAGRVMATRPLVERSEAGGGFRRVRLRPVRAPLRRARIGRRFVIQVGLLHRPRVAEHGLPFPSIVLVPLLGRGLGVGAPGIHAAVQRAVVGFIRRPGRRRRRGQGRVLLRRRLLQDTADHQVALGPRVLGFGRLLRDGFRGHLLGLRRRIGQNVHLIQRPVRQTQPAFPLVVRQDFLLGLGVGAGGRSGRLSGLTKGGHDDHAQDNQQHHAGPAGHQKGPGLVGPFPVTRELVP